ncbi:hypothetical protein ABDX87_28290 [Pseudomonas abietaniphila]|uniref:hypothetical protein n=1 Tax=Pseudomonas abietaniphila TaxID=89065 RepID=UPI003216E079
MKDEFTAAFSEVIANQVELAGTIESLVEAAMSRGHVSAGAEVIADLEELNSRVTAFTHCLSEQYVKVS